MSICHFLGIGYNVKDLQEHIFLNLSKGNLLFSADDDEDNDDASNASDRASSNDDIATSVERLNINDEREKANREESVYFGCNDGEDERHMQNQNPIGKPYQAASVSRFSLNFRDIEDSIRYFDGSIKLPVEMWFIEFEETATMMCWDEFQKFVFAKKSLKGIAKLFVASERGITNYAKLKNSLLDEFQETVNSAQLHKMFIQRKMKKDEKLQEYFLHIKEIASRGNIDDLALIQYVIEGIHDANTNKVILYGAKNIKEFKEKLKTYELFYEKCNFRSENKNFKAQKEQRKKDNTEVKCYNCGIKGHKSLECKSNENGLMF